MPRGGKREGAGPKPRRLIIEIKGDQYIVGDKFGAPQNRVVVALSDGSYIVIESYGPAIEATLDKMRGLKSKGKESA